jgi:hypothetical protein
MATSRPRVSRLPRNKATETKFHANDFGDEDVDKFLDDHKAELEQEGNHLGGWIDGQGRPTLDVSGVSDSKLDAAG